jgi:YidC/Oxa1 family membrane protein insertase
MGDQKNMLLAIAISIAIILGFNFIISERSPAPKPQTGTPAASKTQPGKTQPGAGAPTAGKSGQPTAPGTAPSGTPAAPGTAGTAGTPQTTAEPRPEALAKSKRVRIETPRLAGSIALKGARFDDLTLTTYRETLDKNSPNVTLLNPLGAANPYYVELGWAGGGKGVKLPGPTTEWTTDRKVLKPGAPVTLTYNNGEGLIFQRTIAIDKLYMITVTQTVRNAGGAPVTLHPYALARRIGEPKTSGYLVLHEGPYGVFRDKIGDSGASELKKYKDLREAPPVPGDPNATALTHESVGGWIGMTDHYWMVAVIPQQARKVDFRFVHLKTGDGYQTDYTGDAGVTVPAGGEAKVMTRVFAGAKEVHVINGYADKLHILRFDLALDWGWFPFLTKPIFWALDHFYKLVGNFGIAILLLTVSIKAMFFPLANRSYKAMGKMKALTPKMQSIRERFKDNKEVMNRELMELYKREKVNPMAGCWPILIQIPVFFALYKTLFVTIEMRHAPFFGWIQDLSVRDPTSVLNLFGLLPFTPPDHGMLAMLSIGVWPLAMGISMFLQQRLNPTPPDPMQAKIFMLLPIVFTFILARFAAGLVIYWTWNNLLSIAQQWVIMKRHGRPGTPPAGSPPKKSHAPPAASPPPAEIEAKADPEPEHEPTHESGSAAPARRAAAGNPSAKTRQRSKPRKRKRAT